MRSILAAPRWSFSIIPSKTVKDLLTRARLPARACIAAVLLLAGCDDEPESPATAQNAASGDQGSAPNRETGPTERWYSAEQQAQGATVFSNHCAECHGDRAQGTTEDWRQRLADGSLPPPPLNGSAHGWHHPLPVLLQVINNGGAPFGGKMPAFEAVLAEDEKLAAIAYFQSFWSDEIYGQWQQMGGRN